MDLQRLQTPCSNWSNAVIYKLAFSGLSLELSSLLLVLTQGKSLGLLAAYLTMHVVGSTLFALALALVVPGQYKQPRRWLLAYLFAFNFFMPIAGLVCALTGIAIGVWFPRRSQVKSFDTASIPQFTTYRNHEGTGFRGGQVRAQLNNVNTPLDQRLKALIAVQDTPARATGNMLRDLLADAADDIRLLAYGILDGKEKQITQRILDNRQRLETIAASMDRQDRAEQSRLHKAIAELYWELIYQNLVQGDMQSYSADQVRHHIDAALVARGDDAGLWFLLARLELQQRRVSVAEIALMQAQRTGFARERLLPYIAELRFLQGRHGDVRALFVELAGRPGIPALASARRYWLGGSAHVPHSIDQIDMRYIARQHGIDREERESAV